MARRILTITLLLVLGIAGAMAQNSSTTPGVPVPNDPHTDVPKTTAPDQQSDTQKEQDHAQSSTDQQQYPDAPRAQNDQSSDKDQSADKTEQENKSADQPNRDPDSGNADHSQKPPEDRADPHSGDRIPQF